MKTAPSNYLNSSALVSQISTLAMVGLSASCLSSNKLDVSKHPKGSIEQSNYIEGIDISHHQEAIDWSQLTSDRSGKTFVIIKATEGATYQDPMFVQNITCSS